MQANGTCSVCLVEIGFSTLDSKMKNLSLREMIEFSIGLKVSIPSEHFRLNLY